MRKRIGIFLVLIFAVLGISACTKDPYSKMNMTVDNSAIELTLTEIDKEIKGSSERISVTVDAPKDVSKEIVLPTYGEGYGNEYVDIIVHSNDGEGNYELDFVAKKQGYTEIQIKTLEGYLSETITINIDVALDSISFKDNASVVVEIGSTYNFNTYGRSLLQFEPSYTTQTNVRFEIVNPEKFGGLVSIEEGILKISPSAKVTDFSAGLKVNAISTDNDVKSTELRPLQIKVIEALKLNNSNILKVNLKNLKSQKSIQINSVATTSSESNVNYEIIFASPDVELDPEDAAIKLDETLIFGGNLEMTLRRTDYKITYDSEYSEYVDITDSGTTTSNQQYIKSYGLIAKDAGQYTATFKVDYVGDSNNGEYDGIYTKYINVKIRVVALPTSKTIMINDENYLNGENVIAVYDSYAVGMGSKLTIRSTNNSDMTFKIGSTAGAYPVNSSDGMGGVSGVIVELNDELIDTTKPILSGSTLYLQNKVDFTEFENPERVVELRITLTSDISNEYYSNHDDDRQTYSKTIKVKLNLISGLEKIEIDNFTMDIVSDKAGKLIHEFDKGVIAKSVVDSVRYGNSRLFTYGFGEGEDENKMYLYPTPYTPGDSVLYEGTTNLVIYLTNGIRSYTADGHDTQVTVKATYTTNTDGTWIGHPVVVTNLDTDNEGFFAYGSIIGSDYAGIFSGETGSNYTREEIIKGPRNGVYYNQFSNVIVATYSELKLDLYKLFIYTDEKGKNQVGYVNANTLTVQAKRSDADASSYVQWYNGRLYVYGNTTYNSGTHTPVVLEVYNGITKIYEINVYICKRIGKVSLVQKHFDLYDGTQIIDGANFGVILNEVYFDKSKAKLEIKVWEIGENGVLIEDEDYIMGEYGNFYRTYQMLGALDIVFRDVKRENLLEVTPDDTIFAHLHVVGGEGFEDIGTLESALKTIYADTQSFSFDGRLKQFDQEFVINFSVNVDSSVKTSNIATNVDKEMGVYFEVGDDKSYKFNYTVYTSQATFKDIFVDVVKPNGTYAQVVIFNNEYKKDLDGNYILDASNQKIKVYKIYNGFTDSSAVELYNQAIRFSHIDEYTGNSVYVDNNGNTVSGICDDLSKIAGEYFLINIGNGSVNLVTNSTIVGTYTIKVSTMDSYKNGDHGNDEYFEVVENFNFYIANGTINAPFQIRSYKDFEDFLLTRNKNEDGKYFVLATDIYLNKTFNDINYYNYLNQTLNNNLSGKFVANEDTTYKRTIYGLNIALTNITSDMNIGLFTDIKEGMTLNYLSLDNTTINVVTEDDVNLNIGAFAGKVEQGTIIGSKVKGTIIAVVKGTNNAKSINIGGLVGSYTGGSIMSIPDEGISVNNSDINSTIRIEYTSNIAANLGGIVGYINGVTLGDVRAVPSIVSKNLVLSGSQVVSSTDYSESNIGGIAGYAESAKIVETIAYPIIVGKTNIGGIVGYLNNTDISNSQVQLLYNINMKNVIAGLENVGGIAGNVNGDSPFNYVYVRSYTTKEVQPFHSDRQNIDFYTDYTNKYYGGIVLLKGIDNASVGGMVGKGRVKLSNSYFMSHVVSFETSAKIGAVVGISSTIELNNSYVDGKITYFDHVNKKFYNSFNIISSPISTSQVFDNSTYQENTVTEGALTSEPNSYIVITQTRTWKNASVTYTDNFDSISVDKFYAKVNNTLFGIENSKNGSFSYKSYSDKIEKITVLVYNTGSGLKMYAKDEIYENSPNGVTYSSRILGTLDHGNNLTNGNKVEIWDTTGNDASETTKFDEYLSQRLIALDLQKDNCRYYFAGSAMSGEIFNSTNSYDIFNKFSGLASVGSYLDLETALTDVANECNIEISSNPDDNDSLFKVVKTIDYTSITLPENGWSYNLTGFSAVVNFDVDGEIYRFQTTSLNNYYKFLDATEDNKSQTILISDGWGKLNQSTETYDSGSKYIYTTTTNTQKTFKFVVENDAVYRLEVVAEKSALGETDYANVTDYDIESVSEIKYKKAEIWQSVSDNFGLKYAHGPARLVYLSSVDELNSNDEAGEYKILSDKIYHGDVEVTSNSENYYAVIRNISIEGTNINISTDSLAALYGKSTLSEIFTEYGFTFTDGEVKADYSGDTYYRYGNDWYYDSSFSSRITEEYILDQLEDKKTDSTYDMMKVAYYNSEDKCWYKDSAFQEKLVYFKSGDDNWYSNAGCTVLLDNAIKSQLYGKYEDTNYYDKKDAYYVNSDEWVYFVNGDVLDLSGDTKLLDTLNANIGNGYYCEAKFYKNSGIWQYTDGVGFENLNSTILKNYIESLGSVEVTTRIYCSKWKDISGNDILNIGTLGQLNGKTYNTEYNVVATAYYLDNWYSDEQYTNKVSDISIINALNANVSSDYVPSNVIKPFNIVIGGALIELNSNVDLGSDLSGVISQVKNDGGLSGNIGIKIVDNVLYVIGDTEDDRAIDTIIINGQKHYVLGKTIISSVEAKWLLTEKINDNLPVSLMVNYNMDLSYNGSYSNSNVVASYKLYYDELATLSLRANDFEKAPNANNDYISDDPENKHGHIKVDDSSVVLMYNKLMSGIAGSENTYKMAFGEQDGHYVAVLNGIVVDLSGIEIDKESALQLVITSTDNNVVSIARDSVSNNFNITVKGEGYAELNFYNLKDDSIKVTLKVYVIKGFTNFVVSDDNGQVSSLEAIVNGESSDYVFSFINEADGYTYEANNGGFKLRLLEIDGRSTADDFEEEVGGKTATYSTIKINNLIIDKSAFANNDLEFTFDTPNLSFLATNQCNLNAEGSMKFEIIPYVICDGTQVYIEDLKKEIEIKISNPAQTINFSETHNEQLPEEEKPVTVSIYSNYDGENLVLKISGVDWATEYVEIDGTDYSVVTNPGSLLKYRLKSSDHKLTTLNGVTMYLHTYTLVFSMNTEEYRIQTLNSGHNAIASSISYNFVAYPSSHCDNSEPLPGAISSSYRLTINPVTATSITTNFYPYMTTYNRNDSPTSRANEIYGYELDQIYDIHALPPDEYGLLKIEINPKYNNTLIVQVEIDNQYIGLVNFQQIISIPYKTIDATKFGYYKTLAQVLENGTINNNGNINVTNTTVLWEVPYASDMSEQEWLFAEYYLAVYVSSRCPQGVNVPITVRAFDDNRNEILRDVINLFIEPIPQVSISIDNSKSVVKGVDEYVPLQITAENIDSTAGSLQINTNGLKIYTYNGTSYQECDFNTQVFNPNTQYYVHTVFNGNEYNHSVGNYEIEISTSKDINGISISASDNVLLKVVWLTLESVVETDAISGVITMQTGMYKGFKVSVTTNKTGLNGIDEFNDKLSSLGVDIDGMTPNEYLEDIQNRIAGRDRYENSYWEYYVNDTYSSLDREGELYPHFMYSRYVGSGSDQEEYFRISAIQSGVLQFRLFFHYAYTSDGLITIDKNAITGGEAIEYYFTINIKENSSQDSPIPIYDVEDLINMERGVNYILQADISIDNWKPISFDAAYLDGNGFTISISSFDMSELKGKNEVYAGIFTSIAEGSIIKNLNIDISKLLYNDNALSDVKNDEITPNIDLRETPTVYFGVLAGENLGTIINVKIVNLDNRKNENTLYVGITRGYFDYDGESVISQGYVGGVVSLNSGVITNSFIGINKAEEIERTVVSVDAYGATEFTTAYTYVNPFRIESCNNVGGFVYLNSGTITNSYIKSVDIINNARISNGSSAAGFVVVNSGEIYSTAVSTNNVANFKSTDTLITSSSITGGFVHTNTGVIEDSYTNIQINNQNVETAGFAYRNSGSIKNCYTTSKNTAIESGAGNTESHGLFVYDKADYGIIENSYYLIFGNELGEAITDAEVLRNIDPANAIVIEVDGSGNAEEVTEGQFAGFNFASSATEYDGVWYLSDVNKFPELSYAENVDYFSLRQLVNISTTYFRVDKKIEDGNTNVSMEIYQLDDGHEEILESFNSLSRKTNVWYFYNGNRMFQVVNNVIIEVNTDTAMEITVNQSAEAFEFGYDGVNYSVLYNAYHKDHGFTVYIDGVAKNFANYSFTYLGFEFIVIREGDNFKMVTNNGFSVVTLSNIAGNPKVFTYGGNSTYTYMYMKNNPGSKYNPLIVTNSEEFAKYIVNNTNEYILKDNSRVYIFGLVENAGDGAYSRYIHLANDIDFRNEDEETDRNIAASYEVNNSTAKITINDVIFNGVLIGNSMSINNIILNSTQVRENYGIFNEVGVNDALRQELRLSGYTSFATAQVFNTELNYLELSNSSANKVGLLAGTISNAVINKIDITGVEQVNDESQIIGQNLVGALAGFIYGTNDSTKISEITVSNANVLSTVNQLSNLNSSTIATNQEYKEFRESAGAVTSSVKEIEFGSYVDSQGTEHSSIRVLKNLKDTTKAPSYAGAIAGAIIIDTKLDDNELTPTKLDNYTSYDVLRSKTEYFHVSDLTVENTINIQADVAGGIAGYIGARDSVAGSPTTYYGIFASNLELVLNNNAQQNIYGYAYAGGIVGQTKNAYFMQTIVSHEKEQQDVIDQRINLIDSEDVSRSDLFSKNMDTTKYNIAIGGIVGRMDSTWIVDSMSKVNVENQNSFIGGGIAGHVTGDSYLAYVYTTGNVLAKNIIGGLVGYYYTGSGESYNLNLYNTFAVNVWNDSIKDLLTVNEKAYKYTNGAGADLSEEQKALLGTFNSMPELGNQRMSRSQVYTNTLSLVVKDKTVSGSGITDNTVKIQVGSQTIYSFRFSSDGEEKRVSYLGYEFTLTWNGVTGVSCAEVNTPPIGEPLTSYYTVGYSTVSITGGFSSKTITITPYVKIDIDTDYLGFASYERFTYIGSVLGRYSAHKPTNNQELLEDITFVNDFTGITSGETLNEIIARTNISAGGENEEYYTYYNKHNFNVISTTYGKVEHDGSISEGDYSSVIADDKINLSYFKSVYGVNGKVDGGSYNSSNIDNFKPMFGKQYYISYITGDFINNSTDEKVGNKYYKNEFTTYYGYSYYVTETNTSEAEWNPDVDSNGLYLSVANLDRLKTKISAKTIDSLEFGITGVGFEPSFTWYVDNQYYLAKYGYNSNDTFGLINSEESMYDALTLGKSGIMYRIDANTGHGGCSDMSEAIYHIDGTHTGDKFHLGTTNTRYNITNNIYYAATQTTIKFAPNNSEGIVHLFDVITSSTFMNIIFEIDLSNISPSMLLRTNNIDNYFGFFANVVNGVVFNNCKFVIKNGGNLTVPSATGIDTYIESMGLVVGFASNSVFTNCEFEYDVDKVIGDYSLINFGAFAGNTWQSTFIDMSVEATSTLTIQYEVTSGDEEDDDSDHSFGGFLGLAQSSRIESIGYDGLSHFEGSNMQNVYYSYGSFIGRIQGDSSLRTISIRHTGAEDIYISASATSLGTLNAGIVGYVDRIGYIENLEAFGFDNANINLASATNINVNLGVFGLVNASSSRLSMQDVDNYLAIEVNKFEYTGATARPTLSVGGIVGNKTTTSVLMMEKCINTKNITLTNLKNTDTVDDDYNTITVNVGGLVGRSSGINIKQSVNLGAIDLSSSTNTIAEKVAYDSSYYYNTLNVGGIVGLNNSGSVNLQNVINYGDQKFVLVDNRNYRIGGLVGNASDRSITTTYTLALGNIINTSTSALVSKDSINGFAHNYRELNNTSSHYVAEHDPRTAYDTTLNTSLNYKIDGLTDNNVVTIAWQYMDFLNSGDKSLSNDIGCLIKWKAGDNSYLPVVDDLNYTVSTTSGSKFNPKSIDVSDGINSSTISSTTPQYVLVPDNIEQTGSISIPAGTILTSNMKSGAKIKVADGSKISTNYGTLSNIIFQSQLTSITSSGALFITSNYGKLMNIGFTDIGNLTYNASGNVAPIMINYGGIYATGSLISLRTDSVFGEGEFSFLVHTNSSTGDIVDSYTRGEAQGTGSGAVKFGAIAANNSGNIENTYFSGTFDVSGITLTKAHNNITTGTAPKSSFSNKSRMSGGNKLESGIKALITDGNLKDYMWSTEDATFPYIKGCIKLIKSFVDGQYIYTIPELNEWISALDGGVNDVGVNIELRADNLNADAENRTVNGTVVENNGTINVICIELPSNGNAIRFADNFIEENTSSGIVTFANTVGVTFSNTLIGNNSGTVTLVMDSCEFGSDANAITTNSGEATVHFVDVDVNKNLVESNSDNLTITKLESTGSQKTTKIPTNSGTITFGSADGTVKNIKVDITTNSGTITTTTGYKTFTDVSHLLVGENSSGCEISNIGFNSSTMKVIKNSGEITTLDFTDTSYDNSSELEININSGTIDTITLTSADFLITPKMSSGNATDDANNGNNAGTLKSITVTNGTFKIVSQNNAAGTAVGGKNISGAKISSLTLNNSDAEMVSNAGTIDTVNMSNGSGTAMSKTFKISDTTNGNSGTMKNLTFNKVKFNLPKNTGTIDGLTLEGDGSTGTTFGDIIGTNTGTVKSIQVTNAKFTKPLIVTNNGTIGESGKNIEFNNSGIAESSSGIIHTSLLCGTSDGTNAQIVGTISFVSCSIVATASVDTSDAGFVCAQMDQGPSGTGLDATITISNCTMTASGLIDAGTVVGDLCSIVKGSITVSDGTLTAKNTDTGTGGIGGVFGLVQYGGGEMYTTNCSSSISINVVDSTTTNRNIGGIVGYMQGYFGSTSTHAYFGAGPVSYSGAITIKSGSKAYNIGGLVGCMDNLKVHEKAEYSFTGTITIEDNPGMSMELINPWSEVLTTGVGKDKGIRAYELFGGYDPYTKGDGNVNAGDDNSDCSYWFNTIYHFNPHVGPFAGDFLESHYSKFKQKIKSNTGTVIGLNKVGYIVGYEMVKKRQHGSGYDDMHTYLYRTVFKFSSSIVGKNTFKSTDLWSTWKTSRAKETQEGQFREAVNDDFGLKQVESDGQTGEFWTEHNAGATYGDPYVRLKSISTNVDDIWEYEVTEKNANSCQNTDKFYIRYEDITGNLSSPSGGSTGGGSMGGGGGGGR